MLKKTLVSIAVSGVLYVSSSYALELGELTSRSKLDEPYRGEIKLSDVAGLSPQDVRVRLGSESEFKQAGLVPTRVLSQLSFQVARENGQLVVLVQSDAPLDADELKFVLAARWPSGQVVREYQAPVAASALVDKASPEVVQSTQQSPTSSRVKADTVPFEKEGQAAQQLSSFGQKNVQKGNTLWSIAKGNQTTNQLTIYQTMMAIQSLNREAFIANNINLLKEGTVLRLPTEEQIKLFNRTASKEEFERQHQAWVALKQAGGLKSLVERAQLNTQANSNTIPAPVADKDAKLTLASGQSELPEKDASSNPAESAKLAELEDKLSATQEGLDKELREKKELSGQLSELNSQLDTLEKLISLKDKQMAELQRQFTSAQQALQEQKNTVDQLLEADQLRREQAQAEADSWVNKIFGNPIVLSIGGVVMLLLGFLVGMLVKRSGKKKLEQDTSMDEFDLSDAAIPAAAATTAVAAASAEAEESAPEPIDDPFEEKKELEEEDPFAFDFDTDAQEDASAFDEFDDVDEGVASVDDLSTETPLEDSLDDEFDPLASLEAEMDELADEDDAEAADLEDAFPELESEEEQIPTMDEVADDDELGVGGLDDFDSAGENELEEIADASSDIDDLEGIGDISEEDESNSEEEEFVSNLLNDVDQDDVDESSVFDEEPSDTLAQSIEESLAEAQNEVSEDDLEIPEFGEAEAAADEEVSDDEENIDFFDASGDEVATKLDLARAYMDMGDEEGARVILEDVIETGNEQQVAEAESMMERMFPSE
ncbi:FimV/HubP family polar landmark protein [Marinomonas mediterranea]|uniref:FimV/HubP family polar landmark protein n=1 Tax=Marinomonas mediterranea TaxID=119864 RepID=UPI00234A6AF3|nr:FimV/HubP family polar landmark protein [Marinomonas mediterranea]WCN09289.1 pilus assembly protein FimV [Marinomonas mediterranea]